MEIKEIAEKLKEQIESRKTNPTYAEARIYQFELTGQECEAIIAYIEEKENEHKNEIINNCVNCYHLNTRNHSCLTCDGNFSNWEPETEKL
jgi:hypothetical protein